MSLIKKTKYKIWCNTENIWTYGYTTSQPTTCFNDPNHSVDLNKTFNVVDKNKIVRAPDENMYGATRIADYTPIVQQYTLYGIINDQLYTMYCSSNGTITSNNNGTDTDLNISNDLYSYAVLRSKKVIKYRPGYSNTARFNLIFDTPIANCLQFGGLGNHSSDLYFCYNGTDFGVRLSTGGDSEVRHLEITAAETSNSNATIFLDGVEFTVPLTDADGDINFTCHEIANYSYTGWNVEQINNYIFFQKRNVGSAPGSYSYSSDGVSSGTFTQERIGSSLTTTFISKNNWNGTSDMIELLDPLKRNMYYIEYAGNVIFKVYNPDTSRYENVHTMKFANLQTEPSMNYPNMYLQSGIASLGSTTIKKLTTAGGFGASDGKINIKSPIFGVSSYKSIAKNSETVLITVKNRNTINGYSNQSELIISRLSFSTEGNKPARIRIIKNPTTISNNTNNDYTNWEYINESNSVGIIDKTSNSYTGGELLDTFYLPKEGNLYINLIGREIELHQQDVLIITAESRAISEIDMTITILEDQ